MKPIIVIGTGLAGYTVAREFRKLDKITPLVLITGDAGGFYSKPMLSNAFAQGKQAAQLITQTAEQMAAQLDARIVTGTRVTGIDSTARTVDTTAGQFDYNKLVIAVGAQPIRLAIAGDAADQVLSVNNIDDYVAFRARLAMPDLRAARVTILGAGLIGCEFADDLAGGGHAVTLVDPNALPLAALASPALSSGLHAALTARGVALRLGTTATTVDRTDAGLRITLADGSAFDTDIILSAVGLRPDTALAQVAQLKTGRGIVVDASGETSAPAIYAVGDCAEYTMDGNGTTRILPYIAPLMAAARASAKTLTGVKTVIDMKHAPVIVKTPSYPLALVAPAPHLTAGGTWHEVEEDGRTIARFYDAQGMLLGFGVAPHESGVRQELLSALGSISIDRVKPS